MDVQPIILSGHAVRLEPLSLEHVPALTRAGSDESIWKYMLYGAIHSEEDMRQWVQEMLRRQMQGTDLPFVVMVQQTGEVIGATRYMEIRSQHRGLEIGGSWYAIAYQRTVVNTECKYLLLKHAFESLGVLRVQFKTDVRNKRSQRALERIGAVKEGVFRNHIITPEGYLRDSVFYSIIVSEWPEIKRKLEIICGL